MCICSYMYRSCIESLSVCITGLYLADCYEIIHAYRVINILNCKFLWSNQVQYAPLGREVHMYKYMYNLYSCMYMYKIVFFCICHIYTLYMYVHAGIKLQNKPIWWSKVDRKSVCGVVVVSWLHLCGMCLAGSVHSAVHITVTHKPFFF